MASRYSDFRDLVRDWSNRDSDALSNARLDDAMSYAADDIYSEVEVVPFEVEFLYTITQDYLDSLEGTNLPRNSLVIPQDASRFIQLKETSSSVENIYDYKLDIRTIENECSPQPPGFAYARRRNRLVLSNDLQVGQTYILYYYRRLPALDARYDITVENITAGRTSTTPYTQNEIKTTSPVISASVWNFTFARRAVSVTGITKATNAVITLGQSIPGLAVGDSLTVADVVTAVGFNQDYMITEISLDGLTVTTNVDTTGVAGAGVFASSEAYLMGTAQVSSSFYALADPRPSVSTLNQSNPNRTAFVDLVEGDLPLVATPTVSTTRVTVETHYGNEIGNWIRDENRKMLLFKALEYCFRFLEEPESIASNEAAYEKEKLRIENEDRMRNAKGGSLIMNYDGFGQI